MYRIRPPYLLKKLYSQGTWRKSKNEKKIYLTFDDGPVPEVTPWVLDILKANSIKATFFCVGENVEKHKELYQRILQEQHAVGNHTYSHINGWKTPLQDYLENIEKCAKNVRSTLFRPPYGRIRKKQQRALADRYTIVMWDVLTGDYDRKTSPKKCLRNAVKYTRNGSIIVFHDSIKAKSNIQYALPRFIEAAKANGYSFEKL
jgi:peptidoglycan/xylan/chitin deacetylase (PgdA/CDA1 family)